MSKVDTILENVRERLDVIEVLADIIMEDHSGVEDCNHKGTCKLAVLISELCDQADAMLEEAHKQLSGPALVPVQGDEA